MKTQLSNAILYSFYGVLAIGAVILTATHPKEMFISICAMPFVIVGIYVIVKAFKRKRP